MNRSWGKRRLNLGRTYCKPPDRFGPESQHPRASNRAPKRHQSGSLGKKKFPVQILVKKSQGMTNGGKKGGPTGWSKNVEFLVGFKGVRLKIKGHFRGQSDTKGGKVIEAPEPAKKQVKKKKKTNNKKKKKKKNQKEKKKKKKKKKKTKKKKNNTKNPPGGEGGLQGQISIVRVSKSGNEEDILQNPAESVKPSGVFLKCLSGEEFARSKKPRPLLGQKLGTQKRVKEEKR